jgi:hypothetical protein
MYKAYERLIIVCKPSQNLDKILICAVFQLF